MKKTSNKHISLIECEGNKQTETNSFTKRKFQCFFNYRIKKEGD